MEKEKERKGEKQGDRRKEGGKERRVCVCKGGGGEEWRNPRSVHPKWSNDNDLFSLGVFASVSVSVFAECSSPLTERMSLV